MILVSSASVVTVHTVSSCLWHLWILQQCCWKRKSFGIWHHANWY